jgi:hypothetical protein
MGKNVIKTLTTFPQGIIISSDLIPVNKVLSWQISEPDVC